MQKLGLISNLEEEVKFVLIEKQKGERECAYFADAVYEENGQKVIEDCKGYKTEIYRLKKKLMLKVYGIRIREV